MQRLDPDHRTKFRNSSSFVVVGFFFKYSFKYVCTNVSNKYVSENYLPGMFHP